MFGRFSRFCRGYIIQGLKDGCPLSRFLWFHPNFGEGRVVRALGLGFPKLTWKPI